MDVVGIRFLVTPRPSSSRVVWVRVVAVPVVPQAVDGGGEGDGVQGLPEEVWGGGKRKGKMVFDMKGSGDAK